MEKAAGPEAAGVVWAEAIDVAEDEAVEVGDAMLEDLK